MTSKNKFNAKSFAENAGKISGFLMGRAIAGVEKGLDAFEAFANGNAHDGQRLSMDAIRAPVQRIKASLTKPFALDARELSLAETFAEGVKSGTKSGLEKKPAPIPRKAPAASLKPG